MKVISSLIFSCSLITISFYFSTKVIANNHSPYLSSIFSTNLVAQNEKLISEKPSSNTQETSNKEEDCICCICINKFCLANKVTKDSSYICKPNFWGHVVLIIVSGLIIGVTFIILNLYAIYLSNKWMNRIRHKNLAEFPLETIEIPKNIHESIKDNPHCEERLMQQLREIQIRTSRHKECMLYFYTQHFISISMTSGLALIAGICLIFIADAGIREVNPALINIFITTASVGLFYQRLPGIFQQELNREANRSLFLKYTDLGNIILSYLATGKIRNNTQITNQSFSMNLEADKFIHFIDQELARFNQLPIEFDPTKVIKITDLQESINDVFSGRDQMSKANGEESTVGGNGEESLK